MCLLPVTRGAHFGKPSFSVLIYFTAFSTSNNWLLDIRLPVNREDTSLKLYKSLCHLPPPLWL